MSAPADDRAVDFGTWHAADHSIRVVWDPASATLAARTLTGPRAGATTTLRRLPHSGHPDPRRAALIAEAALAGWAQHSARPDSMGWLTQRLDELAAADLQAIDWTAACPSPGCPRHGEAMAPHSAEWGETCDRCLGPRTVTGHALTPPSSRRAYAPAPGSWPTAPRPRPTPARARPDHRPPKGNTP